MHLPSARREIAMKSKLLYDDKGLKTYAIVFDKGDEVRQGLLEFANSNRFADAYLNGIGAFSEVTLGFFDPEQVEVLAFTGNIAQKDGQPKTPCSCGRR